LGEWIRTARKARTSISARRCARACTPEPRIASDAASARASSRVASAVTAAVRIEVSAEALRIAVGRPVSPSNSVTVPWWASSPSPGLAGKMQTALRLYTGCSPPR
jgi:hypothetical protein